jgi:hypothetical protein
VLVVDTEGMRYNPTYRCRAACVAMLALAWVSVGASAGFARTTTGGFGAPARHALARHGYTSIRLSCIRRACRWEATRDLARCSGTLAITAARHATKLRITRRRCASAHRPALAAHPRRAATSPAPAAAATVVNHPLLFGFNTYVSAETIARQRQMGATVSRLIIPWSLVEPTRGQWLWQQYDQQYAQLLAGGLKPEIVAFAAPCWARPSIACEDSRYTSAPDPAYDPQWREYIRQLTTRYPQALGIEIWNEPNLNMFFWPQANPARYTQLLKDAYTTIKSVNPAMPVISAGILASPATGMLPAGEGDAPFLAGIYAAGANGYINAIGAHPYPITITPNGSEIWDPAAMEQSLQRLRAVRNNAGAAATPIWITETGVSTTTQPGFPPAVTPSQQAADLVAMVHTVQTDSDVPVMIIHTLQDQAAGTPDAFNAVQQGFGIFTATNQPKPAACALTNLLGGTLNC